MADDDFPRLPRRNQAEDDPKMIGLWKIGRTIGKGSSGRVRIARHTKSGKYAAVKIVSKNTVMGSINKLADSAEHMLLSIEREIVIMKLIDHPNIMRLYDVWETSSELYLILEYVEGGELFDYLCDKGRLSTSEALGYFQQIISAIDYCHQFNIAHRDLKPENLLMDENKNIKVADFGMAAWQAGSSNGMLQTACGSPHYAAPEVVMGKEYNGRASDIWSCGVILYALLAGRLPFDDEDLAALLDKVKSGKFDMPSGIDAQAKDLISKMLHKDVTQRITIPDILKHPFYLSEGPGTVGHATPKLDAISRPLENTGEIDQDIFANLRTLWHGVPDKDIIDNLQSDEPNWQKGVYHLLLEYRTKHLENYDEEEEEMEARSRKRKNIRKEPQGMRRTTSQATDLGRSHSSLPPRAAPPTPRRADRTSHDDDNDYPISGPQITLHSPSPSRSGIGMHSPLSPSHLISRNSPLSPIFNPLNLPALTVPDIQDDKMHQFLQKIVEHLNAMETRAAMTGSTPKLGAGLHAGNATAPPPTPIGMEFAEQRQHIHDLQVGYDHSSVMSRGPRFSPGNFFKGFMTDHDNTDHVQYAELGQENQFLGIGGPGIIKKSSLRNRGGENSGKPPLRVHIVEPSPGKLRKKRSGDTSALSSAFSDSSFALPSTPRRRWLGNVFKFKPVNYHLLSIHDGYTTREECRRLLVGLGARVVLAHAEGSGVLKCRFDEVKDPSGTAVVKGMRFRVEVHKPTPPQIAAGYQVSLHLVQEKGASSSFQFIHGRLRRVWELDAPETLVSMGGLSPALTEGGRYKDLIYPD
ncbi:Pkinase-domain-containing protein [Leucogyrophana mollusca]|uniref:Pkinase-domain-containing protein n=1 Tax=Leucogyrophana mollusca TaxID=85980 RepID=A0ACB8BFH1_9AGAM|nr:Pkinase-domain-containing protein [Leucogyrophana mollusca]